LLRSLEELSPPNVHLKLPLPPVIILIAHPGCDVVGVPDPTLYALNISAHPLVSDKEDVQVEF
jgi:hypothetical protein